MRDGTRSARAVNVPKIVRHAGMFEEWKGALGKLTLSMYF